MPQEKQKTTENTLFNASFLLGKFHCGLWQIVASNEDADTKIIRIEALEKELRKDIEKLYYVSPSTQPQP